MTTLDLVEREHGQERLVHLLLLGGDVAGPGHHVGVEAGDLAGDAVAVGLDRRRVGRGGLQRLLAQRGHLLTEVLTALLEVDPPREETGHLAGVGLHPAAHRPQRERHRVGATSERGDGPVVGRGPRSEPVAEARRPGHEAAEVVDLGRGGQQLAAVLTDRGRVDHEGRHRPGQRREHDRHRSSGR